MNSNFGNSDFEEPEGHPVKHESWAQKNLAQALTQSLAGEGCCPARGGWNHALPGSLIASWNCTPWVRLPITFLITVTQPLVGASLWKKESFWLMVSERVVHGYLTPYTWAKLWRREHGGEIFAFWWLRSREWDQKGPGIIHVQGPAASDLLLSAGPHLLGFPGPPQTASSAINQTLIKKTWAYARCTKTMRVAKCLRHCV